MGISRTPPCGISTLSDVSENFRPHSLSQEPPKFPAEPLFYAQEPPHFDRACRWNKLKEKAWQAFKRKAVEVIVAILTAAITALTTTSCMGYGPL